MAERDDERAGTAGGQAVDYAISQVLAGSQVSDEAFRTLLAAIGTTLGWDAGVLWEVDPEGELLHCAETWHVADIHLADFVEISCEINFAPGVGLPGRVWASGEPVLIQDVGSDDNFPRFQAAADAGLRTAFAVPITSDERFLGVIEFFAREPRALDNDLLESFSASGSRIGQFMERRRTEEGIRRSEALKTAMLESSLDCVIAIDHKGHIVEFNPAAEQTFGYKREEVMGRELAALIIPPKLRDRHRRALERYLSTGQGTVLGKRLELTGYRADESEFPVEVAISRIGTEDPPMFIGYVRDITDRKQGEQALQFVAGASAALDDSLDLETTLQTLAKLPVPYLADGCQVDVVEEDGSIRRAAATAADPTFQPVLDELRGHPIDPAGPHPIARAIATGEMQIVPTFTDTFRHEISGTDSYYEALTRWPARSAIVVPLKSKGRVLGSMALASFSSERSYGPNEISVIEELARRAASALENARAFQEQSRVAGVLRRRLFSRRTPGASVER